MKNPQAITIIIIGKHIAITWLAAAATDNYDNNISYNKNHSCPTTKIMIIFLFDQYYININ